MSNSLLIHGRFERGFGWMAQPNHYMERSSTALAHDGKVWLIDPEKAPGVEAEIGALGSPAGIISSVGWHDRDVDWFAALYGIPVYGARQLRNVMFRSPLMRVDGTVPGTPFRLIDTSMRGVMGWWTESALWWPEERVLVTGDCIGTATYFAGEHDGVGVHPFRRLSPPDALSAASPQRIYCGHGRSVSEGASAALNDALRTAKSNVPGAIGGAVARLWRRRKTRETPQLRV